MIVTKCRQLCRSKPGSTDRPNHEKHSGNCDAECIEYAQGRIHTDVQCCSDMKHRIKIKKSIVTKINVWCRGICGLIYALHTPIGKPYIGTN